MLLFLSTDSPEPKGRKVVVMLTLRKLKEMVESPKKGEKKPSCKRDASPTPTPTLSTGGDTAAVEAAEEEIREEIATMYVLRSTYVGKLEAIVQSAIDEYTAGEHTSERRTQVVYGKLEELTALEKECDQKVAAVVARLRELLKAIGQDDSLAKEVEATYEEEKSLKKAYYLKEFQGG